MEVWRDGSSFSCIVSSDSLTRILRPLTNTLLTLCHLYLSPEGLATLLIAFLLFKVLPSSPEETSSFLPPHLHSLLLLSQPPPPPFSPPLLPTPPPGLNHHHSLAASASSSHPSSRAPSPHKPYQLSPARLPLLTSLLNRARIPTPLETLFSPLTIFLSLGYLLLLLATTPSAFLPRILQSRYALSERTSNLLVGIIYAIGGVLQLGVGAWAGRKGVVRVWRVVAVAVVLGWMSVGVWEGLGMQGRGPEGGNGELRWNEDVGGRWVGIALRLLVTMGESFFSCDFRWINLQEAFRGEGWTPRVGKVCITPIVSLGREQSWSTRLV